MKGTLRSRHQATERPIRASTSECRWMLGQAPNDGYSTNITGPTRSAVA
jgi:nuclear transport factor 2 (NTF2) superfamily protein